MTRHLLSRRKWLGAVGAAAAPFAGSAGLIGEQKPGRLKISLNAYSFHKPLSESRMNLDDLLEFCAAQELAAADLTAYYFPGYPEVPPDDYLYELKYKAFRSGVDISGTGVRNDFAQPDPKKRKDDIALVKNWIVAAGKLGAPVIRVFSGTHRHEGYSREEALSWMVKDMQECVSFGRQHGVAVAVQNHHDFLMTADQTLELIRRVNSPWFGLILDIGSFRGSDPYGEIARCIPHALNWQIKELVYTDGVEEKVDLDKLFRLIAASGYRGYLPIETLGPGDPYQKVPVFLKEVREALKGL